MCYTVFLETNRGAKYMKLTHKHTLAASYLGYITQAVVNNLTPLLFVVFETSLGISIGRISLLITVNFGVQMLVDLLSAKWINVIGTRRAIVAAHAFAAAGLVALGVLPYRTADPYVGVLCAVCLCAVGGGITEVLISPIVEALPSEDKAGSMSLLHAFYCWGHVGVVVLSTLYFALAGTGRWALLPVLWAVLPLCNMVLFARVPLCTLAGDEHHTPLRALLKSKMIWLFLLMMVCAGASEQGMSQWASLFAETGLKVPKAMGDLLGPCAFAVMMGLVPYAVRHMGRAHQPETLYGGQLPFVRGRLCCGSVRTLAAALAGGLRAVRFFGGHSVAGHIQPFHGTLSGGRHGHVCVVRPGGRRGMRAGPGRCRRGVRHGGRRAESGAAGRVCVPGAAAAGGVPAAPPPEGGTVRWQEAKKLSSPYCAWYMTGRACCCKTG